MQKKFQIPAKGKSKENVWWCEFTVHGVGSSIQGQSRGKFLLLYNFILQKRMSTFLWILVSCEISLLRNLFQVEKNCWRWRTEIKEELLHKRWLKTCCKDRKGMMKMEKVRERGKKERLIWRERVRFKARKRTIKKEK